MDEQDARVQRLHDERWAALQDGIRKMGHEEALSRVDFLQSALASSDAAALRGAPDDVLLQIAWAANLAFLTAMAREEKFPV